MRAPIRPCPDSLPALLGGREPWVARIRRAAGPVAAIVAIAVVARLVYGRGLLGYDAVAALLWGTDIAHGRLPDFHSAFAPTPHPLFYLGLAPLSLLGDSAAEVVEAIAWLTLGLLGYAAFRFGRALFSTAVGIGFAALLLTRPLLVGEVQQAFVDIPCLALVLLAGALEAEKPRRGVAPLVLLGLAGLLRPEVWLLAGAYALWAMRGRPARAQRLGLVALAAAGPLLWALCDLAIAGDPFHSLHSTQTLAERLGRARGLGNAFDVLPDYLEQMLGGTIVLCGIAGAFASLYLLYRRSLIPATILGLGLASFLVLGVAGLPLLRRYLLPAGAMLGLFCAVGLLGWTALERGDRLRRAWAVASIAVAAVVVASLPGLVDSLRDERDTAAQLGRAQRSVTRLLSSQPAHELARRCRRLTVSDPQMGPQLALSAEVPLRRVRAALYPSGAALFVAPRDASVRSYYLYEQRFYVYRQGDLVGFRRGAANREWALWERC